jgi:hypothetical protein
MKQPVAKYLDQVEYVCWTAMDLNMPAPTCANGFVQLLDFGGGFNFSHFLDPRPCIALAQMWESQFRRRTKAFLIVEMPKTFRTFLSVFVQLSKPSTRNKMQFCASPAEALEELRALGCNEETLARIGGSMEQRRQQAPQTWHPIVDLPFFTQRLATLKMNQDSEFLSAEHHSQLREAIQEFRVKTWGPPMLPSPAAPIEIAVDAVSSAALVPAIGVPSLPANGKTGSALSPNMASSSAPTSLPARTNGSVEPNISAMQHLGPAADLQTGSWRQPMDSHLGAEVPAMSRSFSGDATPSGPSVKQRGLLVPPSAQGTPSNEKATAVAPTTSKGCGTGIARLLKKVVCCADDSGRLQKSR